VKKSATIPMVIATVLIFSGIAQATLDIPANDTFNIDVNPPATKGMSFAPVPWDSSSVSGASVYMYPFASVGLYSGTGNTLSQATFSGGSVSVSDVGQYTGDLGIRIIELSNIVLTFAPSILTLDFVGGGSLDVYLPGFTFTDATTSESIFFMVAQSGATYYANSSKGTGVPDMSAATAMAGGDLYLARVPEPATVILLGLGGILFAGKRKR